jgi:cell shape-determining protein MreC
VNLQPEQSFSEVIAEPASALDRDREVLLVWNDQAAPGDPKAKPAAGATAAPTGAKVADAH